MQWRNSEARWGSTAQLLHWSIALLIIGLVAVGLLMQELPNSLFKVKVYGWHKSTGLLVFVLVLIRLLWRLLDRRPPNPDDMPRWQQRLSSGAHGLLYVLMIGMPLSGWLYNSAANFPLRWFGLFSVPSLAAPDPALKQLARQMHEYGFYVLAALFTLHVGAALHHHYVKRDATLTRMLPRHSDPKDLTS